MDNEIDDEDAYQLFVDEKMGDAAFVNQVQGMEPEAREAYMRSLYRSYADEAGLATEELAMAEGLRNKEMPTGGMAGDVYVAANPLEFAAKGFGDYKANGMRRDARADLDEQAAAKAEARNTTADLIRGGQQAVAGANLTQQQKQNMISLEQQAANEQIALSKGLRSVAT